MMRYKHLLSLLVLLLSIPAIGLQQRQDLVQVLKKRVVEVGKLKFKRDIPVKYFDSKELKAYVDKLFEDEYPAEFVRKEEAFLELMGFVPRRINLKAHRKRILLGNVGGMYNEKTGELFVLERFRQMDMMNSMLLVHELRHAIQDQHFNLAPLLEARARSDFDDRRLALLAALEGDAVMVMFLQNDFDADMMTSSFNADALLSFLPNGNNARLSNSPAIIKYQLIMPYNRGLQFMNFIFKKKKWKGVGKVLTAPPVSSEQILHPQKYLQGEAPLPVEIRYRPEGYTLYHSAVVGEYYLNILLQPGLEYIDYAFGWGGDRCEIYKKGDDNYFMVWESAWDEEKYCGNFYHDLKRFLKKKYDVSFREGSTAGRAFIAGKSAAGYFFLSKHKNSLYYVRSNDRVQINKFISGGQYD